MVNVRSSQSTRKERPHVLKVLLCEDAIKEKLRCMANLVNRPQLGVISTTISAVTDIVDTSKTASVDTTGPIRKTSSERQTGKLYLKLVPPDSRYGSINHCKVSEFVTSSELKVIQKQERLPQYRGPSPVIL